MSDTATPKQETTILFDDNPSNHVKYIQTNVDSADASHLYRGNDALQEGGLHIFRNFILFAVLFSINHGAVASCLSLATARLGDIGGWQSSLVYFFYTLSALFGATYVTKSYGPRNAIIIGMSVYCVYVGCFVIAVTVPSIREIAAILGALGGGIGGGLLWTSQGAYFTKSSEVYSAAEKISIDDATSLFGGVFAAIYLSEEVLMRLLSSLLLKIWDWSWVSVFITYTILAVSSTVCMVVVTNHPMNERELRENASTSPLHKATATYRLLVTDAKMIFLIPLCGNFGLSNAFFTSFVNAEVVRDALNDDQSIYVGVLTSITAAVAAIMSLGFGYLGQTSVGKGPILIGGCLTFLISALYFVVEPDFDHWNFGTLLVQYSLQGIARATFEGTFRAELAVLFASEKEGAFGCSVFLYGLISTIGFFLATNLSCSEASNYCIEYADGRLHDVLSFEMLIIIVALLGIIGYIKARYMFQNEEDEIDRNNLVEDYRSYNNNHDKQP